MASSHLRVATLNIWNRSGPWPERLRLIREQLRALDPDVLGLQEVLRTISPGEDPHGMWHAKPAANHDLTADQASAIAAGSHPHVAYAAAMDYGNGLLFGNAVASKHPILETKAFELPGKETGEARALLYTLVDHPKGKLPLFVTHLNWKLHHGAVRTRQIVAICECIKELSHIDEGDRLPPVLVGDFNADPDSDEMRYMRGLTTIEGRTVYFADAWIYGGDGTPGTPSIAETVSRRSPTSRRGASTTSTFAAPTRSFAASRSGRGSRSRRRQRARAVTCGPRTISAW